MARSKALIGFLGWLFVFGIFILGLAICTIGIDERTSRNVKKYEDGFRTKASR